MILVCVWDLLAFGKQDQPAFRDRTRRNGIEGPVTAPTMSAAPIDRWPGFPGTRGRIWHVYFGSKQCIDYHLVFSYGVLTIVSEQAGKPNAQYTARSCNRLYLSNPTHKRHERSLWSTPSS